MSVDNISLGVIPESPGVGLGAELIIILRNEKTRTAAKVDNIMNE